MSSQRRREKEREEVRARILDAARELFVAQGVEAVTMRKIAARIDYTATALYSHFADKKALLRAVCDTDFKALRGAFERIARIEDPIERLGELGREYVRYALEYPNHYRLMFMTPHTKPDPAASAIERGNPDQDAYAFLKGVIAEAIRAGRFRSELDDADLLAQLLWGGLHGVVSLYLTKGNDGWIDWRPVQKTADLLIAVTLKGLLREGG
jgi:AcrR family transcriptional regulator